MLFRAPHGGGEKMDFVTPNQEGTAALPLAAPKERCGAPSSNPTGLPTGGQEATQHTPLCPG